MKLYLPIILISILSCSGFGQTEIPKNLVTVLSIDGTTITGKLVSRTAETIKLEVNGKIISLPSKSVSNVSYNANSACFKSNKEKDEAEQIAKCAEEILDALRPLVVARDKGVPLAEFAALLVTAKTNAYLPLSEFGYFRAFYNAINNSLDAYQHAVEAWQRSTKTPWVSGSSDYGKWAIKTYNVKKKERLKRVSLLDVRDSALTRAGNYFREAEAMGLE